MEDDALTIMFVRKSGKIRSIKIEVKKIFYLAIGVLSLIIAFVGLLYGYYLIYHENNKLLAMVENREVGIVENIDESIQPAANLNKEIKITEQLKSQKQAQLNQKPEKKLVENISGNVINVFSINTDSNKVTIQDFKIERNDDGPGIKARFNIVNVNHITKITGYWIVVGEQKKKNKTSYKSYPKTIINTKGEIVDHKDARLTSATWFSIERLKPVKGILEFDNQFDNYDIIHIYVYSSKGELLLNSIYNRWETAA